MSRIGKNPISVPDGVKVDLNGQTISATGPKGSLNLKLVDEVEVSLDNGKIVVRPREGMKGAFNMWGMQRTLINNLVIGVQSGFSKVLEIVGVGYRAQLQGKELVLNLGFSHEIKYAFPDSIKIEVEGQNKITVSGSDKQVVGQVAAEIRSFRPPEPYKGKGVKYIDEYIVRKEGKKK